MAAHKKRRKKAAGTTTTRKKRRKHKKTSVSGSVKPEIERVIKSLQAIKKHC